LEAARDARGARHIYTEILEREPTSYYGVLARRRLDGQGSTTLRFGSIAPAEAPAIDLPPPPFADDFHLPRWLELHAAGVADLARLELAAIERDHGQDPAVRRYLVDASRSVGDHHRVIRLVRSGAAPDLAARDRLRLTHPLAFWTALRQAADEQAVDPFLVVSIMRQESLFDPFARSKADARGLLQLLPATAAQVAPALSPAADPGELYDPETNLRLGTRYLRTLLDRFNGDVARAVAAYNAGEPAAERWSAAAAGEDPDVFVEAITYRETRDYVKRIVGNYAEYERLYGKAAQASDVR
jgi:soluble lytic murein transglycosylase